MAEAKKQERWEAQQVPVKLEPMVVNSETGEAYDDKVILAMIMNKLEIIEKAVLS